MKKKHVNRAPKSREMQHCLDKAKECIRNHKGPQPSVPLHLRNAPTRLMKELGISHKLIIVVTWWVKFCLLGYGKGYSVIPSQVPEMIYMPQGLEQVCFFD